MNNYDYLEKRLTEISYELQALQAMYPEFHTIEVRNNGINLHGDYDNGESFMIAATKYHEGETYLGIMSNPYFRREYDIDNNLKVMEI